MDRTHLRGQYKGHLLTALTTDANGQILPLAFAVVDAENNMSWTWFVGLVREHIIKSMPEICIISDRHAGIFRASEKISENGTLTVHHRICLRHLKSNLMKHVSHPGIKDLCWVAGAENQ